MQMKIAETICIETRLKLTFRIPTYIDVGLLFEAASQRADGTFTADVNGFTMRFEWIIPRPLNAFAFFFFPSTPRVTFFGRISSSSYANRLIRPRESVN